MISSTRFFFSARGKELGSLSRAVMSASSASKDLGFLFAHTECFSHSELRKHYIVLEHVSDVSLVSFGA